jgi:hypothetical protein
MRLFSSVPAKEEAETIGRLNQKFFGNCAWRPSLVHRGRNRVCFQKIYEATARWYDAGERVERNAKHVRIVRQAQG